MKQNIHLYIGDNASGKTRVLKSIIKDSKNNNKAVVTNIQSYSVEYVIDKSKKETLINSNNYLINKLIVDKDIETMYEANIAKLLSLLYSKGDILVIDDIDLQLTEQDIIYVSKAIADVREKWDAIYVTGYSNRLLRMFTDINYETYRETTTRNVYYVDTTDSVKLAEEKIHECFNKIRR